MNINDTIFYNAEARQKLKVGINKLADAVKCTMGPYGRTVVMSQPNGAPHITKDGVSVAEYVKLIDPVENMGAQLMKQAANKTVEQASDGTTTATVIAQALINNAENISHPTKYRKFIEQYSEEAIEYISKECSKIDLKDTKTLNHIALVSSNNDQEIATNVVKAMQAVGLEGIIEVEIAEMKPESKLVIENGFKWERGYITSNFVNVKEKGTCELKDVWIMLFSDTVDNFSLIIPTLTYCKENSKALVVIAKEFSEEFIKTCEQNCRMGNVVVPILNVGYNNDMINNLEDLSIYLDTSVISQILLERNQLPENYKVGIADSIIIDNAHSFISSDVNIPKVLARVKHLKTLQGKVKNPRDLEKIQKRISSLSAGTAKLYVYGHTPADNREQFDRCEDAVGAVKAALEGGILPGGGTALYKAAIYLSSKDVEDEVAHAALNNVIRSIKSPFLQILANADNGCKTIKSQNFNYGYNLETDKEEDFVKLGIIDPIKVTTCALRNAVSIAVLILTTGCAMDNTQLSID